MKKMFCIILAAALFLLSAAGLAEVTGPRYLGTWACGRATIVITDEHPGYRVNITWGSSAAEVSEWDYYCPYELVDGSLVSEPSGVKTDLTYAEGGEIAESVTGYDDGEATFTINDAGKLTWFDTKEDAGKDMEFEPVAIIGTAPAAEELAVSYFGMIGDSALSLDKKACEALNFAAAGELWLADADALRANMLEAWEGLTDAGRAAFDGSFMEVVRLLDACFEDWDANRAAFEDGRDERMEALLAEPLYREAWDVLRANTLTLVNSED